MVYSKVYAVVLLASLAASEPPVTGYNYQAPRSFKTPSNSYLPPSTVYNPPSNNYLPPPPYTPSTGYSAPGNALSAPSNGYSAPGNGYSAPSNGYSAPSNGYSNSGSGPSASGHDHGHDHGNGHDHEVPKSYEFGYSVKDAVSGNDYGRRESSDGNVVRGEYRVQLPDGRTQIVTYHADWLTGFHADVRYEGEARYPEPSHTQHQGGYNYNPPAPKDFQGSLTGFNNQGYKPSATYGTPSYH